MLKSTGVPVSSPTLSEDAVPYGKERDCEQELELVRRDLEAERREKLWLRELVERTASPANDGELGALMELVLEGLHQGSLLSRDDDGPNRRQYGDMLAQMARSLGA